MKLLAVDRVMKDRKSHFLVSAFVVLLALAFLWPTPFVSQGVSGPGGQPSEVTSPAQAPQVPFASQVCDPPLQAPIPSVPAGPS